MLVFPSVAQNAILLDMHDGLGDLVTAEEAAQLRGVNSGTVRRWANAGRLTAVRRIGKTQLFRREDVLGVERPRRGRPPQQEGSA